MLVPETSAHLFSQPSAKRKKNGLLTPADTALEHGKSKEAILSSERSVFFSEEVMTNCISFLRSWVMNVADGQEVSPLGDAF